MFDMTMTVVSWVAWAIVLLGGATHQGGSDSTLAVRPVRFFSPGTGSTIIEGTSEIPLHALAAANDPTTRYRVEITVADPGPGFPAATIEGGAAGGSAGGFGLPLCRKWAGLMGGALRLANPHTGGAEATVLLPRATPPTGASVS